MITEDLFSVFEWLPDDSSICVGSALSIEAAVERARVSTRKPAVLLGIIQRVTIVDNLDCTVFLWENGKGLIFPVEIKEEEERSPE